MSFTCAFCNSEITNAVNSIEGNEYYSVCKFHLNEMIAKFEMVEVEMKSEATSTKCDCGCQK